MFTKQYESNAGRSEMGLDTLADVRAEGTSATLPPWPAESKCLAETGNTGARDWALDPASSALSYPSSLRAIHIFIQAVSCGDGLGSVHLTLL